MTTEKFSVMGKEELRAACRAVGIPYGKLDNSGMRLALLTKLAPVALFVDNGKQAEEVVEVHIHRRSTDGVSTTEPGETPEPAVIFSGNPFGGLMGKVVVPEFKGKSVKSMDGMLVSEKSQAGITSTPRTPKVKAVDTPAPLLARVSCKGYKIEKEREVRNGIKSPSTGTLCLRIWEFLDTNPNTVSSQLKGIADSHEWDRTTMHVQFYVWRKFNGIGRSNVRSN